MEQWDNVAIVHVLLVTSSTAFLVSIITTILVDRFLVDRISIAGVLIGLERTQNAGIAFGIDAPSWLLLLLIPLVIALIAKLAWRSRSDRVASVGFGLILGGALGNIADRFDDGFVTDFIQVGWWPVFNVADSCITTGVVLLLLLEIRKNSKLETRNPK